MDLIIVLCDYVNHNLAGKIKDIAKDRNVPIVYSKRSWSSLYQKMVFIRSKRRDSSKQDASGPLKNTGF